MRIWIAMVGAAIGLLLAAGARADFDAQVAHRLKQLSDVVASRCHDCDGVNLDDPASVGAIRQASTLLENWTVAYFAHHAAPKDSVLDTAIRALGQDFDPRYEPFHASALVLGDGAYVVKVDGEYEDVFVLSSMAGRLHVDGQIGDLPIGTLKKYPGLASWSTNADHRRLCRFEDRTRCQMMGAMLGRLPDAVGGGRRFFVLSSYFQAAGCTYENQLSIWGRRNGATTLLLEKYYVDHCESKSVRLAGNVLHIDVKDEYKTLSSYGCCAGRQVDWRIRIDPNGIKDLGETADVPELDLVDGLFDRIIHRNGAADLASPQATQVARKFIVPHLDDISRDGGVYGDLDNYRVTRKGSATELCMMVDPFDGDDEQTFQITLAKSSGRQVIARADLLAPNTKC